MRTERARRPRARTPPPRWASRTRRPTSPRRRSTPRRATPPRRSTSPGPRRRRSGAPPSPATASRSPTMASRGGARVEASADAPGETCAGEALAPDNAVAYCDDGLGSGETRHYRVLAVKCERHRGGLERRARHHRRHRGAGGESVGDGRNRHPNPVDLRRGHGRHCRGAAACERLRGDRRWRSCRGRNDHARSIQSRRGRSPPPLPRHPEGPGGRRHLHRPRARTTTRKPSRTSPATTRRTSPRARTARRRSSTPRPSSRSSRAPRPGSPRRPTRATRGSTSPGRRPPTMAGGPSPAT